MGRKLNCASVRIGNISGIVPVCEKLRVDIDSALTTVGLPRSVFDEPETQVPYMAAGELLHICQQASNCEHIGLLIGMHPPDLALPGYLMFNAPTVRAGFIDLVSHLNRVDNGGVVGMQAHAGAAIVTYTILAQGTRGGDAICEIAITIGYQILKRALGPQFAPIEIRLPRRQPRDTGPYRSFFSGARVVFDAVEAAIEFPTTSLDAPVRGADPKLYRLLKRMLGESDVVDESNVSKQLLRVLPGLVRSGQVDSQTIARMFGIHPRTLARRLAADNLTLHQLIDDARFEAAQQLLRSTDRTLTEIAVDLSYSDASAFTRAFRRRVGASPGAWRKAQTGHVRPSRPRFRPE